MAQSSASPQPVAGTCAFSCCWKGLLALGLRGEFFSATIINDEGLKGGGLDVDWSFKFGQARKATHHRAHQLMRWVLHAHQCRGLWSQAGSPCVQRARLCRLG